MARLPRLLREQESLEAVIESIGGETELRPLLTRILTSACELIGADDGAIGLVDDERRTVRTEATYCMPINELGTERPSGSGLAGRVLQSGAPVRARRYGDLPGADQTALAENAVIGVPIMWRGRMIGVFGLGRAPRAEVAGRRRRRGFTVRDVEALSELARHAAIAIENAHRYARERHRAERLALIGRVGQLVTANLRLEDLLRRAATAIHELLGYENVAIPLVAPDDPGTLVLTAFGGTYKDVIAGEYRLPVAAGLMGAAVRERAAVLVNDVSSDPRYVAAPGSQGVRSELAVPILLGTRVLGVVNVESAHPFTDEDSDGLRIVAGQLAVAIENARLYEASQRAAVLEERHRLARELHDSVAQQLFSATLVAQAVGPAFARDRAEGERRADMLLGLTRSALGEMRALLSELRPLRPDELNVAVEPAAFARIGRDGLVEALRAHVASQAITGLAVSIVDAGYARQSVAREAALFRIAQEALNNVVKHARATRADVTLDACDGVVRLCVRDDGVGIATAGGAAPTANGSRAGGIGLASMRERAAEHGGAVRVERASEGGTVVEATLPLELSGTP
jgi:signal transduction histidine kinase